jgi:hypothetical protein
MDCPYFQDGGAAGAGSTGAEAAAGGGAGGAGGVAYQDTPPGPRQSRVYM